MAGSASADDPGASTRHTLASDRRHAARGSEAREPCTRSTRPIYAPQGDQPTETARGVASPQITIDAVTTEPVATASPEPVMTRLASASPSAERDETRGPPPSARSCADRPRPPRREHRSPQPAKDVEQPGGRAAVVVRSVLHGLDSWSATALAATRKAWRYSLWSAAPAHRLFRRTHLPRCGSKKMKKGPLAAPADAPRRVCYGSIGSLDRN